MLTKEISKICIKANSVMIINGETQWAGNGAAFYALHNFPRITEETAAAAFDLNVDLSPNISIKEDVNMDLCDDCANEVEVKKYTAAPARGVCGMPFFTGKKILFFDEKFMKPLGDLRTECISYYLRKTATGQEYLIIKNDCIAVAAVFPRKVDLDRVIEETESFLQVLKTSKKNTDSTDEAAD